MVGFEVEKGSFADNPSITGVLFEVVDNGLTPDAFHLFGVSFNTPVNCGHNLEHLDSVKGNRPAGREGGSDF